MRTLLVFLAMIGTVHVVGQTPSILLIARDSSFRTSHAMMGVYGTGGWGSNALDASFMRKMFIGGEIGRDHTERMFGDMSELNRAGMTADAGFVFYGFSDTLLGSPAWGLQVRGAQRVSGHLGFRNGLFDAVFHGNAQHKGDTMALGPLVGEWQSYQKFGVGVFRKDNFSGATLSFVTGERYLQADIRDAWLYTSPMADTLVTGYSGDLFRSDTANTGWGAGNGIGLALDLDYNLKLASGKGYISVSVNDLGFIAWNTSSEHFRFDSTYTWTGYDLQDVFVLDGDRPSFPAFEDSVAYSVERKTVWRPLPLSVHARLIRQLGKDHLFEAGMLMRPNRSTLPLLHAGLGHYIGEHFIISERVSYGGYGRWGIGCEVQWMPRGKWFIRAGSANLPGWFSGRSRSTDLYFTISRFVQQRS